MEVNEVTKVDKNATGIAIDSDFMIQPKKLYRIIFMGERFQFVENVELKVNRLEIKMGTTINSITLIQSSSLNPKSSFKSYDRKNDGLHNVSSGQTCYIIPTYVFNVVASSNRTKISIQTLFFRFHLSTETLLSHKAMLTNEYFKITTRIENDQDIVFENVSLIITVPQHLRNKGINIFKCPFSIERIIIDSSMMLFFFPQYFWHQMYRNQNRKSYPNFKWTLEPFRHKQIKPFIFM